MDESLKWDLFVCSGFVFCVAVPTLELFQLVGFLIPQWKNNLRRDASSSVNFDKKKKPVKFASLNDRTHLFKVSFLFSSLRFDNHFPYMGAFTFYFGAQGVEESFLGLSFSCAMFRDITTLDGNLEWFFLCVSVPTLDCKKTLRFSCSTSLRLNVKSLPANLKIDGSNSTD